MVDDALTNAEVADIFRRYGHLLLRRCRFMMRDPAAAEDPDLRYLANFFLGIEAQGRKDTAAATAAFAAALEARPQSESASLALAALELQRGEAERAYTRAREPLARRPARVTSGVSRPPNCRSAQASSAWTRRCSA